LLRPALDRRSCGPSATTAIGANGRRSDSLASASGSSRRTFGRGKASLGRDRQTQNGGRGGGDAAASHTDLYYEYHDFGLSNIWVEISTDGGQTWAPTAVSAVEPGSAQALTSTCNTIPGGIAVDENGVHQGRIYAVWETSDLHQNAVQGCDYTQAEAFDHVFLSYSVDGGATWVSRTVFNDPCAPNPPAPPANPSACQDVSELFSSIALDQAGNVYVASAALAAP
jgi:hypothetical protein